MQPPLSSLTPLTSPAGPSLRDRGDPGGDAFQALIEEGQALERLGRREDARGVYERARAAGTERPRSVDAHLLRLIARTYIQDTNYRAAEAAACEAIALAEAENDEVERGAAVNTLAVVRWREGDLDEAKRLYLSARECARNSGQPRVAAMTATNLGIIATVRGDEVEALQYHQSALTDARAGGLPDQVMHVLNNLGMLHTQMGRFEDADHSYTEAIEIGRVLGELSISIVVHLNVARLRIKQGNHAGARAACDEATALAHQIGDSHSDGEAEHIYGVIARAAGDLPGAEQHFLRAERAGVEARDLILQGETARELAELYRRQGRNRQTLQRLNQAHRLFGQLRARRELADIDRRTAQLESEFLDVVRRWGESIESKDVYTQGHCVRVADLACAIWAHVSADDKTSLFWFRIGALLHDVGKLVVPAEVLNKEGPLDPDEWLLVKRHPAAGVELLADIEFPWDVLPIVQSHHERWDGSGYPDGLRGEDIPITARVLTIADVYDALTSKRSYKRRFSHAAAVDIMRRDVGTQFDPSLFEAFDQVLHSGEWVPPALPHGDD